MVRGALVFAMVGCAGETAVDTGAVSPHPGTDPGLPVDTASAYVPSTGDTAVPASLDTTVAGPFAVTVETVPGGSGCGRSYTTYAPDGGVTDGWVVLAHGFSRTEEAIADLARHFAGWGVPVVTTTMCHSTPFDNDPAGDAADLVALAETVGAGRRLYVGHSAGGLRSVLAAAGDPDALGVLGLDLVDLDGMAAEAAPGLGVPVYGLLGEPHTCNSNGNGAAVYAAPDAVALRVTEADHCDFEAPTGLTCTAFCAVPGAVFSDPQIRSTVRGLATAFVVWQAGVEPAGSTWWTAGDAPHDTLVATGAIAPL